MRTTLFTFLFLPAITFSQTQFWVDDFEGASPSSGTRTPENDGGIGGPPYTSYFCRTPATNTVAQSIAFSSFEGSNYWAGEDHDAAGTGFTGAGTPAMSVRQQQIDWSVNITGKIGLSFTGKFAANSNSTPFDNRNVCNGGATTNTDYIIVQYSIDGGAYSDLIRFFTKGSTIEKYLFLENTGDSCGETPQLTNVFTDYSANIAGEGLTLALRLLVYTEGNNEEWGIDNFRLFAMGSLPVELSYFEAECAEEKEVISWTTETETNVDRFELEAAVNGQEYIPVAQVKAAGNSEQPLDYSVTLLPRTGEQVYYRLKTIDIDGTANYSHIISAKTCDSPKQGLLTSFYVENDLLTCNFSEEDVMYELLTITGNSVSGKKRSFDESQQQLPVAVHKGMYLLRITNSQQTISEVHRIYID